MIPLGSVAFLLFGVVLVVLGACQPGIVASLGLDETGWGLLGGSLSLGIGALLACAVSGRLTRSASLDRLLDPERARVRDIASAAATAMLVILVWRVLPSPLIVLGWGALALVILEITRPQRPPLSTFFSFWFDRLVPILGRLAGEGDAYSYLPESVRRFPSPPELAAKLDAAGLDRVRWTILAGGIIAIHSGVKRGD